MRRTQAADCRTLPFGPSEVCAALLDFASYPRWWPPELRVRVLRAAPEGVGSRIEIRPRGGRFVCEIAQVVPDHLLVKDRDLPAALEALRRAGHVIR